MLLTTALRRTFRPRSSTVARLKRVVLHPQPQQQIVRGLAVSAWDATDDFLPRHCGPRDSQVDHMLQTLGLKSLDELIDNAIPGGIRLPKDLDLPGPVGEQDALAEIQSYAKENKLFRSFIGMGYYGTVTPSVILRNVIENPGWYTSYTPYQPEISQGRLEMLLNYQTMISNLTGLEFSNASLLDEGTAAAEAFAMCLTKAKGKRIKFFVADNVHPQSIDLIRTRAELLNAEIVVGDPATWIEGDLSEFCGVLVQTPNTYGGLLDCSDFSGTLKKAKVPLVVATDPLACAVLKTPGAMGADIAVGCVRYFFFV